MIRRTLIQFCGVVWLVAVLGGCGGGPELHPVSGTVSYRGEMVQGATVTFRCEEANTIATGTTDAQGRFELSTYQAGQGAVAGKHTVTVTKASAAAEPGSGSMSMEDAMKQGPRPPKTEPQALLPAKYADPARPQIEYTVSPGEKNEFAIELTD
jgi:hypothetical protein